MMDTGLLDPGMRDTELLDRGLMNPGMVNLKLMTKDYWIFVGGALRW